MGVDRLTAPNHSDDCFSGDCFARGDGGWASETLRPTPGYSDRLALIDLLYNRMRFVLATCRVLLVSALAMGGVHTAQAQELNCTVNIDDSRLSGSDFSYLDDLEQRIEEYLNTQAWTEDQFLDHERIECNWQILMQEAVGLSEFKARLIVATKRPVYGTAQSTPVARINDESWQFEYQRGAPLVFDVEQFDPLTSVLDFYAFLIIGFDYDTFAPLGGTPYFEEARRIADRAQSTGASGWAGLGSERTRVNLINEILDPRFRPLRKATFSYHLNGLDRFLDETATARQTILEAVQTIADVSQDVSRAYVIDLFFSAKYQELAAVFADAPIRSRAFEILSQVDPAHSSTYERLTR